MNIGRRMLRLYVFYSQIEIGKKGTLYLQYYFRFLYLNLEWHIIILVKDVTEF